MMDHDKLLLRIEALEAQCQWLYQWIVNHMLAYHDVFDSALWGAPLPYREDDDAGT